MSPPLASWAFKYMLIMILNPHDMYTPYYDLFITSPRLMNPSNEKNDNSYPQREYWLNIYNKTLQPWKYDSARE